MRWIKLSFLLLLLCTAGRSTTSTGRAAVWENSGAILWVANFSFLVTDTIYFNLNVQENADKKLYTGFSKTSSEICACPVKYGQLFFAEIQTIVRTLFSNSLLFL